MRSDGNHKVLLDANIEVDAMQLDAKDGWELFLT